MSTRVLIIGHPLAAAENRCPFQDSETIKYRLIIPSRWKARTLGKIYRADRDSCTDARCSFLEVFQPFKKVFYLWKGLEQAVDEIIPDAIYCWEEPWYFSAFQVARIARARELPMVFYSAENREKNLPWFFRQLKHRVFKDSYAAVTVTEEAREQLKESGYEKKVYKIPLWSGEHGISSASAASKCLVYTGRLIKLKRVELLIESLLHLPDYRLKIIGGGPEAGRLRLRTKKLGLQERVEFLGTVENSELSRVVEGSSLMVLPTDENARQAEQFGKAAVEALSMKLPVAASRTGNFPELEKLAPAMKTFRFGTAREIADGVLSVMKNYPSDEMLMQSRRAVLENFSPEAVSRQFHKIFETV